MPKFRTLSLGLILAAGPALAQEPARPAVRLLPARVMDPVEAITARAASDSGYDPFQNMTPPPGNDGVKMRSIIEIGKDTDNPPKDSNWKKFTQWMDDRAKAVKQAVTGPPAPQPEPRVGVVPPPQAPTPLVKRFFETKKPPAPEPSKISTASPAYRWYGYGAATPGANQYAPAGDYPLGSAQWYIQTGATPGAFPQPTMNPSRPVSSTAPPAYIPPPQTYTTVPPPAYTPVQPPRAPSLPQRQAIAETPVLILSGPMAAPPMPTLIAPVDLIPQPPAMPQPWQDKSSGAKPPESPVRPASATEPLENNGLIIPIIRGAAPSFDESPLAQRIQGACRGLATNLTISETGPRELVISFQAKTKTLAESAMKATLEIAELKSYNVRFATTVKQ